MSKRNKEWVVEVPVSWARGTQTFIVAASSREEAIEKAKDGEGFDSESFEVLEMDWRNAKVEVNE